MKQKTKTVTMVGNIDPDVLEFTIGNDPALDRVLVEWDCLGTAAHVSMLTEMPLDPPVLPPDAQPAILRALVDIMREARQGRFVIRRSDQDVHLAVERRLTETLGDLGRRIHTARSRNDQVAVDLRLFAREQLIDLGMELLALSETWIRLAHRHRLLPMVGRTHLQPAMPSSVGLWLSGFGESLLDDLIALQAAWDYNDRCPLGSAAGYGVPLPIDRRKTARRLGFAAPHHNVFTAGLARGKAEAMVLFAAAQIMLTLSRFAEDLILYSMPEFGYCSLPPEFCTGSSIMPQKYNPDVLELIRGRCARVLSCESAVTGVLKGLSGGYQRDLQEVKAPLLEGLEMTRGSLRILNRLCPRLVFHPDRLRAAFTPAVFATDAALDLVAAGVPFRAAYDRVRERLGALDMQDPDAALLRKTHEGAPAGLDWNALRGRIRVERRILRERRRRIHRAFGRLLALPYPALEPVAAEGQIGMREE